MPKTYRVEVAYSSDRDITTILEVCELNDQIISTEVVGFYTGKPDKSKTSMYYGKLKTEYEK